MVLSVVLFLSHPSAARTKHHRAKPKGVKTEHSGLTPAQECSKCHSDIYRNWKQSRHAAAYENPVFQTAYRNTWLEEGATGARLCLPCHAPTTTRTSDFVAAQPAAREGVTCSSCHSLSAVQPLAVRVKQTGCLHNGHTSLLPVAATVDDIYHNKTNGGYFAEERTCADCHEFNNRYKVPVGTTYSEWHTSSAGADDSRCQKCHMAMIAGRTANKDGRDKMHDHSLATTLDSMNGSVTAKVTDVSLNGDTVTASITLHNVNTGHYVPTGSPARSLVLEVRLLNVAGDVLESRKRIYRKILTDADGNEVTSFEDAFLHATAVRSDNRLGPGESRTETISFSMPPGEHATVSVELYLFTASEIAQRNEIKIPLSAVAGN